MSGSWYVLQSTSRGERLFRCTAEKFNQVGLTLSRGGESADLDAKYGYLTDDSVQEHSPFEAVSMGHMVESEDPEATHEIEDDAGLEGNDIELHLTRLAEAITEAVGEIDELYVAMDESRASLFEALVPFEIRGVLDGELATATDLWRLTREEHLAQV